MAFSLEISVSRAVPVIEIIMVIDETHELALDALIRLTYISTRAAYLSDEEVVELALTSNRKNRDADITGCLWFGQTRFFQVLEGRRDAVDALYAKIEADKRHHHVRALSYAPVTSRAFGRWGLAQLQSEQDDSLVNLITEYAGVTRGQPAKTSEPSLLGSILDRLATLVRQRIPL